MARNDSGAKTTSPSLAMATIALVLALISPAGAQVAAPREYKDVVYATISGKDLRLDLFMPAGVKAPPLLIWVHGGAWRAGDKTDVRTSGGTGTSVPPLFVARGIAFASIDFRQSTDSPVPAMVYDIKAAIRFLRAKTAEYGYGADRIAIGGMSSGGHLAALVGVTNGDQELEGKVGDYLNQSSAVQAIVDYFGASNLTTILAQSSPSAVSTRRSAVELLFGAPPENARVIAQLASPVSHVDRHDPPLLLLHGDQDLNMPIDQAYELQAAYQKLDLDVYFDIVRGAPHGGDLFFSSEHFERVLAFLHRTIGR